MGVNRWKQRHKAIANSLAELGMRSQLGGLGLIFKYRLEQERTGIWLLGKVWWVVTVDHHDAGGVKRMLEAEALSDHRSEGDGWQVAIAAADDLVDDLLALAQRSAFT